MTAANAHVSAVVVTCDCGGDIVGLLSALLGQVRHIYVVDNGSGTATTEALSRYAAAHTDSVHLVFNSANRGLVAPRIRA